MTSRILFAACASVMLMTSATAQAPLFQEGRSRQDGSVRVQSSLNFFVPGPTGDSEEAQKLREKARRMIYETAARECDLLKETLAKDCQAGKRQQQYQHQSSIWRCAAGWLYRSTDQ